MKELAELGFHYVFDNYDTYYIRIRDLEICVYRHKADKNWICALQQDRDEIIVSENCNIEYVKQLYKLLSQ